MEQFTQNRNGANAPQGAKYDNANENAPDQGGEVVNPKLMEYIRALLAEKVELDHAKFPITANLLDQEITRAREEGRSPGKNQKYVDIYHEKPTKVSTKVIVPVKANPKFNFVGKLLGPKGNTFKRLQEETLCRMAVLGRGSMRDREKEEELRNSLELKYSHLTDELHVDISALAPPAEAYARIAFALTELQKYLTPDGGDDISTGQLKEMGLYEERPHKAPRVFPGGGGRGPGAGGFGRPPPGSSNYMRPTGPPGGHTRPAGSAGGPSRAGGPPRGGPFRGGADRGAQGAKVMSILNRTRAAAAEQSFEDDYQSEGLQSDYASSAPSRFGGGNRFGGGAGAGASDYDDFYNDSAQDYEGQPQQQQWKPYAKTGNADQSRFRATPYARNVRKQ